MKIRRLLPAIVIALAALAPSLAAAQDSRGPGWDFGIDVIYQFSDEIDFDGGTQLDFDDDVGLTLVFGYRFNPKFELRFEFDWATVDYNGTLRSASLPNVTLPIYGDMESFTPRLNAVYNFIDGPLTPFIQAGIGYSWVDTNIPAGQVSVGCWWDPWYGQICTPYQPTLSVDEFTYQAALGVRWDVADTWSMTLAYERSWIDLGEATSTPDVDRIRLGFLYRLGW